METETIPGYVKTMRVIRAGLTVEGQRLAPGDRFICDQEKAEELIGRQEAEVAVGGNIQVVAYEDGAHFYSMLSFARQGGDSPIKCEILRPLQWPGIPAFQPGDKARFIPRELRYWGIAFCWKDTNSPHWTTSVRFEIRNPKGRSGPDTQRMAEKLIQKGQSTKGDL